MKKTVSLPTIDGPLEDWCSICGNRDLPPEQAYCGPCRVAWNAFHERRDQRLGHRIMERLRVLAPHAPATGPVMLERRKN